MSDPGCPDAEGCRDRSSQHLPDAAAAPTSTRRHTTTAPAIRNDGGNIWARRVDARGPLFCGTDLVARIERVEAQLVATGSAAAHRRGADSAGFVIPVAGGVASFAEEGSPLNKVAGLGFGGVPSAAELDEIERAFAACGPRCRSSSPTSPTLRSALC